MTVILALACADGVVMAADSQGTESDHTRFTVQKIFPLHERAVWAGSGHVGIIQELKLTLTANANAFATAPRPDSMLRTTAKPVFDRHYKAYTPPPEGLPRIDPRVSVLLASVTPDGEPQLLELSDSCTTCYYTDRGAHAIGSGSVMAQMALALTSHFDLPGKPVAYGELVAYRALNAVIEASAYGVGHPIDIWTVTKDGHKRMTDEEREAIDQSVGGWQQMEVETLEELFAGGATVSTPTALPAPADPIPPNDPEPTGDEKA